MRNLRYHIIWVKKHGGGYTTEAMQKVIKFAKEDLGIKEIMGRHAEENPASGKILDKLGFSYIRNIPYECNGGKNLYEGKEYILKLWKMHGTHLMSSMHNMLHYQHYYLT
ncbi:GNAT family N-acetyltransferase [Clostridium beijerinckii]|uniref:GNAT family N-acetyltransferase n=1 Tax=Clostridium beijerinckii TaxID=1520 RepID=UPI0014943CCF|nr:GNAT family N-acetyltransferase [Clostridium beijerinckii]NOW05279.1 RimJ/RimL family protein N-acetyltransferase [Clostridium beijerinckii]NYC01579.1 RimJ/RimL family protein N-acetyltransferase [Clostridium beijerinckii]